MEKTITKTLRGKIMRCHKAGWYVDNIARICRCEPDIVRSVLTDGGITDLS